MITTHAFFERPMNRTFSLGCCRCVIFQLWINNNWSHHWRKSDQPIHGLSRNFIPGALKKKKTRGTSVVSCAMPIVGNIKFLPSMLDGRTSAWLLLTSCPMGKHSNCSYTLKKNPLNSVMTFTGQVSTDWTSWYRTDTIGDCYGKTHKYLRALCNAV